MSREFAAAVEDIEAEDRREEQIAALMEEKKITRREAESEIDNDRPVKFTLVHWEGQGEKRKQVKRELTAYYPTDGQLAYLLASMGRGMNDSQRMAAIINIMTESLEGDDKDYFEGRLLTRDRNMMLPPSTLEDVFEYLTEEWFSHPSQSA